jgi:glycerophosphoryl diester phosphodiesterase
MNAILRARRRPSAGFAASLVAILFAAGGTLALPPAAAAFDLQGHRGARALAPENTLAGFRRALEVGVHTLELDLGMSRDGVLVVAHDPRLNPAFTRDAQGRWIAEPGAPLSALTLAEIQAHDVGRLKPDTRYAQAFPRQRAVDGERMPTLDQAFEQVRAWGAAGVRFNIETKVTPLQATPTAPPEAFAAAVVEAVRRYGLTARVTVQSFDWRSLQAVQRLAPELGLAALTARQPWLDNVGDARWTGGLRLADHGGSVPRLVRALGVGTWSPFHGDLTEADLREARALGLRVLPWTVNDRPTMERLIAWGVDGLITDDPELGREAMAARGVALPGAVPAPR